MNFQREKYYSQTEILKKYKISVKKFKKLLPSIPHIKKEVDLGHYQVVAFYFPKEAIHKLNLPLRKPD